MAKVVFMGTPEFAVPCLEALSGCHHVALVVTQPDRKRGRRRKLILSPVKKTALELGLPIWQPTTLRTPEAVPRLRESCADVYVTVATGFILPSDVLALPTYGCLNVHASLLPRWRGAAPINAAILNGDAETGITVMLTDEGLDTGSILAQSLCAIRADDTAETLSCRLALLGADLLIETLTRWLSGEIAPRPQPEKGVMVAPRLQKQDGCIDWTLPAVHIERMVRAYTPWPGTYTTYCGQHLKILRAQALPDWSGTESAGQVIALSDGQVAVATGKGALIVKEVQLAGKRALPVDAFCCGQCDFVDSLLGVPSDT